MASRLGRAPCHCTALQCRGMDVTASPAALPRSAGSTLLEGGNSELAGGGLLLGRMVA